MRGDLDANLHTGSLQNDSSSGSSSPHSNSSQEDILEVSGAELPPKAIYNFSIPEIIKHDPRREREEICNDSILGSIRHGKRNSSFNINESITRSELSDLPPSVTSQNKKRRKTRVQSDHVSNPDDNNVDCHRHRNVPVIDLTGVDSHDECTNHSDSEVSRSRESSFGTQSMFNDMVELYQQRLQNQNRHPVSRNPSLQRLQRYRRRHNEARSRQIVTDGPLVTDDMLETPRTRSPHRTGLNSSLNNSADDSIIVVNEIRGNQSDKSNEIALRMQSDPTFSPPYHSPRNNSLYGYYRRQSNPMHHTNRFRGLRTRRNYDSTMCRAPGLLRLFHHDQEPSHTDGVEESRTSEPQQTENRPLHHLPLHLPQNIRREGTLRRMGAEHRQIEPYFPDEPFRIIDLLHQEMAESHNVRQNLATAVNENPAETDDGDNDIEVIDVTHPPNGLQPQLPSLDASIRFPPQSTVNGREYINYYAPMPWLSQSGHFLTHFIRTRDPPTLNTDNFEDLLNLAETIGFARPRGLDKSDIEKIPSFRYSSSTALETNAKCVVCLSEYMNREKLRRLPCKHDFHAKCIDKWLKSSKTCPVCRDEVKVTSSNE